MSTLLTVSNVSKFCPDQKNRLSVIRQCRRWLQPRGPEKKRAILDGITFSLAEGEILGIVGRNGAGKTTLLKIIAGILRPSSGTVRTSTEIVPMLNYGAGLIEELCAYDNIFFYGGLIGMTTREIGARLDEIIGFAELEAFKRQKVQTFSAGMRARLAFSIAMRAPGGILLLDEIFAVGDYAFQRKCLSELRALCLRGKAIVHVSHDMTAIEQHSDRCLHLENGKMAGLGSSEEIVAQYLGIGARG